ncbi:MAG: cadherin repeat domain-containing protein, partial [Opitutae bacterium]|nr:cadherin repeat domain-containing protein [Opitutae bacterium]
GSLSANDFLNGQPNGSRHVYVALLDSNDFLHNPPVTADSWINYQYQSPTNMWTNSTNLGNGWKNLSWFGNYFEGISDWIFHETLGWVYRAASSLQSSWLYHNDLGWVWTDSSVYPYLFSANKGGWAYLHHPGAGQDPRYYDYTSHNWQDFTGGPGYAASDYNSSSTYQTGSLVQAGTSSYLAAQSVPSSTSPPNTTYWVNLSVAMSALSTPAEAVPTLSTQTILNSVPGTQPTTNQAPFGLDSLSQLTIAENRPLQSVVGILTASDSDAGSILTFSLANGTGSESNQFFTLETNGTLRTMTVFDYEQENLDGNSSLGVRVRVTDQYGAWVEKALMVTVTDVLEAIPNSPPMISGTLAPAAVIENAPAGTIAGQLHATDPDANDFVSFSLVNGGADSPFAIDANGSVSTTRSLDFEIHSVHHLFFRATDNHGAFAEGNLTVRVIDVFQPITETMEATAVTGSSANIQGSVIDDGGMPVISYGFLISTKPRLDNDLNGTSLLLAVGESTNFSALATNLQAGKKYFYRTYASNAEGTSYGSVESFSTTSESPKPSWIDASQGSAAGWWSSPWLGNFFVSPNGWAMHQELGWVFPVESPTEGLWLWKEGLGWLWTAEGVYPFAHAAATGNWLYFYGQHKGTKLFYDYGSKKWTTLKEN